VRKERNIKTTCKEREFIQLPFNQYSGSRSDKGIAKITIQAGSGHRDSSQFSILIIDYSAFIIANHGQSIVRLIGGELCGRYKQQYR
jgi:hypothetical protein